LHRIFAYPRAGNARFLADLCRGRSSMRSWLSRAGAVIALVAGVLRLARAQVFEALHDLDGLPGDKPFALLHPSMEVS
jgi:hypothetical protein